MSRDGCWCCENAAKSIVVERGELVAASALARGAMMRAAPLVCKTKTGSDGVTRVAVGAACRRAPTIDGGVVVRRSVASVWERRAASRERRRRKPTSVGDSVAPANRC
jgi:hypothetical protein